MLSMEPKNSLYSAGRSRIDVPDAEENSWGVRLTSSTSAWRVTAQKPGPSGNRPVAGSGW